MANKFCANAHFKHKVKTNLLQRRQNVGDVCHVVELSVEGWWNKRNFVLVVMYDFQLVVAGDFCQGFANAHALATSNTLVVDDACFAVAHTYCFCWATLDAGATTDALGCIKSYGMKFF